METPKTVYIRVRDPMATSLGACPLQTCCNSQKSLCPPAPDHSIFPSPNTRSKYWAYVVRIGHAGNIANSEKAFALSNESSTPRPPSLNAEWDHPVATILATGSAMFCRTVVSKYILQKPASPMSVVVLILALKPNSAKQATSNTAELPSG